MSAAGVVRFVVWHSITDCCGSLRRSLLRARSNLGSNNLVGSLPDLLSRTALPSPFITLCVHRHAAASAYIADPPAEQLRAPVRRAVALTHPTRARTRDTRAGP
jgi:hypothetical protein